MSLRRRKGEREGGGERGKGEREGGSDGEERADRDRKELRQSEEWSKLEREVGGKERGRRGKTSKQRRKGGACHTQLIKCSLPLSVGDVEDETADGKQHSQTAVGVDHSHHGWVGEVLHLNRCPVWWYPIRPD